MNKLLVLKNLFFIILKPGLVVGLIPYLILKNKLKIAALPFDTYNVLGIAIFTIGLFMMFYCIYRFIIDGKGTLSPIDPTKKLVIKGLYKISRNPMYLGVLTMIIGEIIFAKSILLLGYLILVFLGFHLFVLVFEEPRLRKYFGLEYEQYYKKVRRWL